RVDPALIQHDKLDPAADLVRRLPAERRGAFVLTQLLGLSYAEAAAVEGVPVGTIRSRVARARNDLVEAVGDALAG
ncbi:sigma factor-like helix-turn-helix DNA-binding protein, partial [Micromonospora sp. NPDC049799]|uniref:sigma factor-like helix-turn-helix DNA-binding protein n=1 Tax=Micromonospora sp. NPDC049799 TaxID=3154741 RepID=UPI0033EB1DB6